MKPKTKARKTRPSCEWCGKRHKYDFMDWERPHLCQICAERQRDIEVELYFSGWLPADWQREEARF